MILKNKIFIYFFILFLNFSSIYSFENKILATVDNDIITSIDLLNEANYLIALNQNLANLEKNNVFEIAKKSLIKEKIKIKEILKYTDKLAIDDKYINNFLISIYKKRNFESYDSFIDYLNQSNVSLGYIKNRITVELIWNDLIVAKFSNKILIDVNKIKNNLVLDGSNKSKEYFLSEIIFNIPLSLNLESKLQLIEDDIALKGFENAVLIHSISNSSANNSGEIGWVNENSLNFKIKEIIKNLNINDHTKPITIPGGFLILKINDIRFVENKNFDIDEKLNEIIQIKKNEQLNNYSNIYFNKIQKESKINEY